MFPSSLISIKAKLFVTAKCHCIIYIKISNFLWRNMSYVSTDLYAIFVCRWSISGWSELGIPSHTAGNENDEIRYRLRSRHASWGETIFRWIDEQFSAETECFKERYGNSLCWILSFKICYFSIQKSSIISWNNIKL